MKGRIQTGNTRDALRAGQAIRQAREELGVSQEKLATHADLTDAQISRLERGCNTTDAERLVKICRFLGLDSAELLRLSGYEALADELMERRPESYNREPRVPQSDLEALSRVLERLKRPTGQRGR
jgi:transcriptional regulator with XRE-family HTH domain